MVGLRRLYSTLIVCTLALCAYAQDNPTGFIERQLRQLSARAEKIAQMLGNAQDSYVSSPSDSLAMVIHELEKQSLAIEEAMQKLSERQNAIVEPAPQEPQVADTPLPQPEEKQIIAMPEAEVTTKQTEVQVEQPVEQAEVIAYPEEQAEEPTEVQPIEPIEECETNKEEFVSEELKALFSTTTRRYTLIENEIAELIGEYAKVYNTILASLEGYEGATSLSTLENYHKEYLAAVKQSKTIADTIADRSDLLFTSKSNSYLMFADTLSLDTLRTKYIAMVEDTERTMSEKLMGRCSDLDIAMYPYRLRNTLRLESWLAQHLAPETADSLATCAEEMDITFTLFTPHSTPKHSNAKFKGVTINKKAKERAVSSLPTIKIPSEGELYSIMVANYASLPPSTKVFRGAEPLYRERREDGRTYIYIGLYPTALSAQEDIALLRKTGFKQPVLVMWRDGLRRDDFVDRNSSATTAKKPAMYRIEISGVVGTLPSEVLAIIKEKAPRKEISKFTNAEGAVVYTLGIFTSEKEAQTLATAIAKASSALSATVTQIGKK